ncbi:phage terminase large subunit [Rummeliibacillus stabekisii]|uniref:phage terminase large subunit n=1 Tax=Rummeliibacillus stabekisii TaxID=241244 RepID=UPI003721EDD0
MINDLLKFLHENDVVTTKQYTDRLEGKIEEGKIDAKLLLESGELEDAEDLLDELQYYAKVYRICRGYYDSLYFTYEWFSEERNPENETNLIPKGTHIEDAPDFHKELCSKLDDLNTVNTTKNICWGAPRGSGKSAYLSNIEPIHSICYRTRKYIMIISETASMSQNFIQFISTNLKENAKLREDFGDILSPNKMKNEQDNSEGFITSTDIRVQASSMGGRLRGARHKNVRPDLIICDDLESAQNTNTEDLREKNLHWFNSVVEPLGDITRTAILYMGTLVHGQGLLPNIMNRAEYDSKMYSSVQSEPIHGELWDQIDEMLRDIENPSRLNDAKAFYLKNKEAMDEGVKVLWADRFSYFDLMVKKVEIGSKAFSSEYLNIPSDNESAIFTESHFYHYTDNDLYDKYGKSIPLDIVGFYDIAMGKSKKSDYNSIHIIGRDRRTGAIYVLESWNKQCTPSEAITQVMRYIEQYRPRIFGVETINAQFEIYRQIQSMAIQRGYYFTKIKAVNPSTKKETRIEALEPLFEAGVIRTKKNMRLLHEMLLQFPNHSHDDAPDCLASAIELLRVNKKKGYYYKPEGL